MDLSDVSRLWSDILTRGTGLKPSEAIIQELHLYSGRSPEEIKATIARKHELSAQVWAEKAAGGESELVSFYDSVDHWVFGTLSYHAEQAESGNPSLPVRVAFALQNLKPGDHMDFGAGVSTACLLFSRLGWRTTASDISQPLLDFTRWRFAQNGLPVNVIDLRHEPIPDNSYDLITAFNTMAHVPNIDQTLDQLRRALRPDGILVFDIDTFNSNQPWFLYESHGPILRLMRQKGFEKLDTIDEMFVYRRVERPGWKNEIFGLLDRLRYSKSVQRAKNAVRKALR